MIFNKKLVSVLFYRIQAYLFDKTINRLTLIGMSDII